ncbi:hypothetical protein ACWDR9_38730, partial [Streptosporangium sandarakinum]
MTRRPAAIDDESLIAALRLAAGRDPVPGHVPATARAAFGLRLPGHGRALLADDQRTIVVDGDLREPGTIL